jgi:hypothetical protein
MPRSTTFDCLGGGGDGAEGVLTVVAVEGVVDRVGLAEEVTGRALDLAGGGLASGGSDTVVCWRKKSRTSQHLKGGRVTGRGRERTGRRAGPSGLTAVGGVGGGGEAEVRGGLVNGLGVASEAGVAANVASTGGGVARSVTVGGDVAVLLKGGEECVRKEKTQKGTGKEDVQHQRS